MALSSSVKTNLEEAESALRAALSYSARQEKPFVSREISEMIFRIDNLIRTDQILDKLEDYQEQFKKRNGGGDIFGTFSS